MHTLCVERLVVTSNDEHTGILSPSDVAVAILDRTDAWRALTGVQATAMTQAGSTTAAGCDARNRRADRRPARARRRAVRLVLTVQRCCGPELAEPV
jgi:hypothetical protein